jgi:hypothetical protein
MRFQVLMVASMKFGVFWDVAPCSQVEVDLMMEAVCTSEMSVNFNLTTWRYIPKDSKLHYVCIVSLFVVYVTNRQ